MSMGERIKLIRKRNDLTQVQLAETLGLKQATIGKYENSLITPSFLVLMRISKKFNVDIGWLFTGDKENDDQLADAVQYKGPDIVKNAVVDLKSEQLEKISKQHEMESASVKRRNKIVREVNELRNLSQDLMDRIIVLQEEIKKGL